MIASTQKQTKSERTANAMFLVALNIGLSLRCFLHLSICALLGSPSRASHAVLFFFNVEPSCLFIIITTSVRKKTSKKNKLSLLGVFQCVRVTNVHPPQIRTEKLQILFFAEKRKKIYFFMLDFPCSLQCLLYVLSPSLSCTNLMNSLRLSKPRTKDS